jgi:histidine ammonia-lyase
MPTIVLNAPLTWRDVSAIASGARLELSDAARRRIVEARKIVEALVESGTRAYGINTGVGALSNMVVDRPKQSELSRNIILSHAAGVGAPLGKPEVRAIIAAQINNYAHGHSGVRPEVVDALVALLDADCIPEVPAKGSVGYLTHMAHIALVLIGGGHAAVGSKRLTGADALARIGLRPLVLQAKEGLSLVNGTPCATGLAALAVSRSSRLFDWADTIGAMSFENLGGQVAAFDKDVLAFQVSPGMQVVGQHLRDQLDGSGLIAIAKGKRTQDALSLRAMPQVHGAARDLFEVAAAAVNRELASVTDNPLVAGTPEAPQVHSEAHAVSASLGLNMDGLGVAVAEVAAMSERRLDRLVNPLVSGLPPFLAADSGSASGLMIAQYVAVSLVGENRRLAAPASLDGGITSALQEDHLAHATPAAQKALVILDNAEQVLAIELVAAAQAYDFQPQQLRRAPKTDAIYVALRAKIATYTDDRPLADDLGKALSFLRDFQLGDGQV